MFSNLILLLTAGFTLLNTIYAEAWGNKAELNARRQSAYAAQHQVKRSTGKPTGNYKYLTNNTQPYLVDSIPGLNFDYGELYAGQVPINKSDPSRNMFYVFQPKIGEPTKDLTIWFNGGPGCSSLEGFLQENGQFIWTWGQLHGLPNPYSWVNLTNVIWVEYPVGTGFSTGKVTATSEEEISQDFLGFFKNFQDIFGISDYKIYITGESYAGRYVPYTGAAMLEANDTKYFDISGLMMYDPCVGQCGFIEQTVAAVPYVEKNIEFFKFNDTFMDSIQKAHTDCGYEDYIENYLTYPPSGNQPALPSTTYQYNTTDKSCDVWNNIINAALMNNPCWNVYEISSTCPILFDPLSFPTILAYQYPEFNGPFFNRSEVKKALHVPESVSWAECSGPVFVDGKDYSADPIQKVLPKVIEKTGRVLIGGGDYDFEILNQGTLLAIQNMTWHGLLGFQSEPEEDIVIDLPDLQWGPVFVANGLAGLDGPGQGTMGVSHFERGLMWASTHQSGHMIPQFQPRVSYRHLQWLLGHVDSI